MSKFSLKSEHFTTRLKLVLPGIIVSLAGASLHFLFSIIPVKTRRSKPMLAEKVYRINDLLNNDRPTIKWY